MTNKMKKNLFNYIVAGAIIALVLFILLRHQISGPEGISEKAGNYLLMFQIIGAIVMFAFTGIAFYIFMVSLAIYRTKRFPPGGEIAGKRLELITGERAVFRAKIGFYLALGVFIVGCGISFFLFEYFQSLAAS